MNTLRFSSRSRRGTVPRQGIQVLAKEEVLLGMTTSTIYSCTVGCCEGLPPEPISTIKNPISLIQKSNGSYCGEDQAKMMCIKLCVSVEENSLIVVIPALYRQAMQHMSFKQATVTPSGGGPGNSFGDHCASSSSCKGTKRSTST